MFESKSWTERLILPPPFFNYRFADFCIHDLWFILQSLNLQFAICILFFHNESELFFFLMTFHCANSILPKYIWYFFSSQIGENHSSAFQLIEGELPSNIQDLLNLFSQMGVQTYTDFGTRWEHSWMHIKQHMELYFVPEVALLVLVLPTSARSWPEEP